MRRYLCHDVWRYLRLVTAFLTLGQASGIWSADWYSANTAGLPVFTVTFILTSLGSAINDTISGIWRLIVVTIKDELGDFFRVLKTKPGLVMIVRALIGGPIASTCYVATVQFYHCAYRCIELCIGRHYWALRV